MKRPNFFLTSWFSLTLTLILIAVPGVAGVFILIGTDAVPYFWTWIIALGIALFTFGFTYGGFRLKMFSLEAFNFNMPLAFVIGSLYVTINLEWWLVMIVVVVMIFTALPVNMITHRVAAQKLRKTEQLAKINTDVNEN